MFLGNGNGTFQYPKIYPVGAFAHSLVSGNFRGHGLTDLAVANSGDNTVTVFLNDDNGGFVGQTPIPAGTDPDALVAADFNHDGRTDLAVANGDSGTVSVLFANPDGSEAVRGRNPDGSGGLQQHQVLTAGTSPDAIVAGNFRGHGRTDLAVANGQDNTISVFLNDGSGTFGNQQTYPWASPRARSPRATSTATAGPTWPSPMSTPTPCRCCWPTPTGPSRARKSSGRGQVRTRWSRATSTATAGPTWPSPMPATTPCRSCWATATACSRAGRAALKVTPVAVVAGDFNGDGRGDVAVVNFITNNVSILLGTGDGNYQEFATYAVGTTRSRSPWATSTTTTGPTWPSPITAPTTSRSCWATATAPSRPPATYAVGSIPMPSWPGDFNGDGRLDLAVANQYDDTVSVLLGNGDGTFQARSTYAVGVDPGRDRGGRLQRRRPDLDLAVANAHGPTTTCRCCWATATAPSRPRSPTRWGPAERDRGGRLQRRRPDRPGHRQLRAPTTCRCCWATATGRSPTRASSPPPPTPRPWSADVNGDGTDDVLVIDAAGDILYRQGSARAARDLPATRHRQSRPPLARHRLCVADHRVTGPVLAASTPSDDAGLRSTPIATAASSGSVARHRPAAGADHRGRPQRRRRKRPGRPQRRRRHLSTLIPQQRLDRRPRAAYPGLACARHPARRPGRLRRRRWSIRPATALLDLVVTNKLTGQVSILPQPRRRDLRPARALPRRDRLVGARARSATARSPAWKRRRAWPRAAHAGGPTDLVTINPGSNTLGVLAGLGGGRFANPVTHPDRQARPGRPHRRLQPRRHRRPRRAHRRRGEHLPGQRQGRLPPPVTYDAGPEPTGLTVADVNGDGKLDLLVGNAYGDVLVLVGKGDGTFRPFARPTRPSRWPWPTSPATVDRLHLRRPGARPRLGPVTAAATPAQFAGNQATGCSPPGPSRWPTSTATASPT